MNHYLLLYLVGMLLSGVYFSIEHYQHRKKHPGMTRLSWITVLVITLIYPYAWCVIALDALGVYDNKPFL